MIERAEIVAKAREYLGTPFAHQARVKGVGIDCVGLVIGVAQELGLASVEITGYARQPDPVAFRALMREHMVEKTFVERSFGDVLSFAFVSEQHVGIITQLDPLSVVHCWSKAGKCVEHALDSVWMQRIRGCWSFPEVT